MTPVAVIMENKTCYTSASEEKLFTDAGFLTLWLSALPLVTLFIVTLMANGSIILMFILRSKLRKCRNTYIMSLAVADFIIGLTMPIKIMETLQEKWILSNTLCTVYLTVCYSLFYVSILSIILITADRWWSVNFPFSYRIRKSKKMAFFLVALVWFLSFVVHVPSIVGWNFLHTPTARHHKFCRVPYEYNPGFTISATVIQFFIPLVLLISLNTGLYIKLVKRRNNKKLRRSLSTSEGNTVTRRKSSSDSDNTCFSDDVVDLIATFPMRSDNRKCSSYLAHQIKRFSGDRNKFISTALVPRYTNGRNISSEYGSMIISVQRKYSKIRKPSRSSISSKTKSHDEIVRDFLIRQDNKAVLSLGLLVLMFVICWTPATLCDIIYSLCPSSIPMWCIQFSYWILSLNSALNPFLYGIGSMDFRRVAKSWFFWSKDYSRYNVRLVERLLFNQLLQPCDMIALQEVDLIEQEKSSNNRDQIHVV